MPINWWSFVPKFVDIEPGLLELLENVTGSGFFWDTVHVCVCFNEISGQLGYGYRPLMPGNKTEI